MSRIVVLGMGVPSFVPWKRHAGPGLRAAHLAQALAGAGHEVRLVAVLDETEPAPPLPPGLPVAVDFVREKELLTPALRRRLDELAPDAIVAATVYASALAVRLRSDVPLWADCFGDLMAEAQAKAARTGNDWSLVHFWTLLAPVLERADRFSAVSDAQAHALVGQLGLAGRLSARTAGEELVATVPCAAEAVAATDDEPDRGRARRELGFEENDVVLLASGGVNTWCDVDTLGEGLRLAMQRRADLRLVVTGGEIPGHDEASAARLRASLAALGGDRVRDLGWIDSTTLPRIYAAADLALHVELPLYERRLGAENRVVEWLAHGLPCVTTARSETGRLLVAEGLAFGCRAGDAARLAAAIDAAASSPPALRRTGSEGREWVRRHRSMAAAARPLLDWCEHPVAARDRDGARLLRLGLVTQPQTSIEMLDAYVASLPLRELARRGVRWIVRRAWAAVTSRPLPVRIEEFLAHRPRC